MSQETEQNSREAPWRTAEIRSFTHEGGEVEARIPLIIREVMPFSFLHSLYSAQLKKKVGQRIQLQQMHLSCVHAEMLCHFNSFSREIAGKL